MFKVLRRFLVGYIGDAETALSIVENKGWELEVGLHMSGKYQAWVYHNDGFVEGPARSSFRRALVEGVGKALVETAH
jgi:hypothetical protein